MIDNYIDYCVSKIVSLCSIPSPSGFTELIGEYVRKELADMGYSPKKNNKGVISVDLGGEGDTLVLSAHLDTIGAMVTSIKNNGRLKFACIGGFPLNYVENENCTIYTRKGKKYTGTVYYVDPSVHNGRESLDVARTYDNMEIIVDEIVENEKDVKMLDINPGDIISFEPRTICTKSGFIKSRYLDDKAGAGILLAVAKYLRDNNMLYKRRVVLLFTNNEEIGHGASNGLPQDVIEMISVDSGVISKNTNASEYKVSICAMDSSGPYNYNIVSRLVEIAKENNIKYTIDVYQHYSSDTSAAIKSGYDIKHGLIAPGIIASHAYERTHREAIKNTFLLLKEYITK